MIPGSSRENPIIRPTSRVLLIDERDRAMLFTADTADEDTGLPFWFPPGGGVEPGETHEEAAARELLEETGLVLPLGLEIWHREWFGTLQGQWYRVLERYYLTRCTAPIITIDRWTELELQSIKEYRWWSLEEILAADGREAVFVPRELGRLLPDVLAGLFSPGPLVVDLAPHAVRDTP